MPIPVVRLGQPEMIDMFDYYESDNIKIFVYNKLKPMDTDVYITLKSFLGIKGFDVSGFKLL